MSFSSILRFWYSVHKRNLPWRQTTNPYKIWLSEIILQQTQVTQGLPYYIRFIKKYPTVFDLAKTNEEDILKLWQGLGYYSRARNLHATAKIIVNTHKGVFPNTYKELIKLKGVGDYTASAIASFSFNQSCAVVDGNVYRVLSRYFGVRTPINSSYGIKEFKFLAQKVLDKNNPGQHNQAIMEFGSKQCKPKNPNCSICPFRGSCYAFKHSEIKMLPIKIKQSKAVKKHFNFIVYMFIDGKIILERRSGKGIWQNLYQFPLIETEKSATKKYILESVQGLDILNGNPFSLHLFNKKAIIHKLSHQHLHTKFWVVNVEGLNKEAISVNKIYKYPVPVLIENFIETFFNLNYAIEDCNES